MNTQEDFDFSSPLPVSEALNRLHKYRGPSGRGSFYGTVEGNYFNLQHDVGRTNDHSDDPRVTGYILPEVAGCRVFARTQAPEMLENDTKVTTAYTIVLVFIFIGMAYGLWEDQGKNSSDHSTNRQELTKLGFQLLLLLGTAIGGWRYLIKFKKAGKSDMISQFKKLLEAY